MKFTMDERVKHRLVGIAVILSVVAIFMPAIMKKSSQRFDDNVSMSVKLPPKPALPQVSMPDEKEMFKTVKVAHVDIPPIDEEARPASTLAKAEPLSQMNKGPTIVAEEKPGKNIPTIAMADIKPAVVKTQAQPTRLTQIKKPALVKPVSKSTSVQVAVKKTSPAVNKPISTANAAARYGYAVQLATFSQQRNAVALIARLKSKGYQARFNKVVDNKGTVYKVIVGNMKERQQAQKLQQQLASAIQLNGFIVTTRVS
ncbi:SPOR domain-containing protein [Legionella taurinensis]|uniref:SPOR domain-containing protein n=1 Tax=Legionella taurinensis TaxID=70611 RepID=A0A3A5L657_9GAMM|nr:SPOR domain-containing protein [Legionella taurinensis]MDX1836840.1 SPOR domain-containing protein [Legionella taurinensis]PUT41258.1 SPOR domain-containing protein [Legionella taurinensis]PUT42383.1 SPOR domain-containing protein [Legionella taurinensis]PUT43908.1 SPOR domain-containing protein [Legionella taurinensis]PUT47164.1 SPOR domain-containing protein [Legionella taurinensis]